MRIIACGGRDYADEGRVAEVLSEYQQIGELLIAQGCAPGADRLVQRWCSFHRIPCAGFLANWKVHGKAAGPKRNAVMLATVEPDLVIAFPGGAGTADMVRRAREAGVEVRLVAPSG